MEKDYYKILGITDEEKKLQGDEFSNLLKKRYKKLCLQWHPDRHVNDSDEEKKKAEDMFKDINEANAVLSDPQKRAQYDNGGSSADFSDLFNNFNFGDMGGSPFANFFRGSGFNFGGGNGFGGPSTRVGSDITVEVNISLQEAYKGCTRYVSFNRDIECEHCHGTGSEDGQTHKCPTCNGTGRVVRGERRGNTLFQQVTPCDHCHGTGKEVTTKCSKCNGTGFKKTFVTENISIPAGIDDGMQFAIQGLGNAATGGEKNIPGDLIIRVRVRQDDYFERPDQYNLIHTEYVPFNEALIGKKVKCKAINGTEVEVDIPECCEDGKSFIFDNLGMPDVNGRGQVGQYAVVIKYKMPSKLNDKQKDMLRNFNNLK